MVSLRFLPAAGRLAGCVLALLSLSQAALAQTRILFVGNSFTHGRFNPVRQYNAANVTDENYGLPSTDPRYESVPSETGPWGGIPGIFKKMTDQAGLNYEVHIEAISGNSLQYHYTNALSVIAQAKWNKVVLQEVSDRPIPTSRGGNRSAFYTGATSLEQAIHTANPAAQVYLYETWARADLTYPAGQPYSGLPIDTMTQDLHDGYYRAFFNSGRYAGVAPAGDAWLRAIQAGVAMRDPYNPDPTKVNLWGSDNFHPSIWGAYLSACVLFYRTTGVDPRTLGATEQAAAALGITPAVAVALQQVAYQQVNVVVAAPVVTTTAFTPGNFVAVRVGDGSATLTSAAAPVFLAEYTPTGTLVQTLPLPTTDAGANFAFTNSGTATSDDNLTRSADGRYLVLTGYNATPGTASVTGTTAAATNRIIGRVAADGSFDTSTRLSDAFSATNFRSAASVDGSTFYAAGGNSGIRYLPLGNAGPTTALSTGSVVNFRAINIFGGNLYVSSAANPNYGVNQIGTGLPTTTGQAVTLLPGFPTASGPSPYGIYFVDLSAAVPGLDVVYVADDNTTSGIQKWSLVNGTWTLNGTIGGSTTVLLRGLTGTATGSSVRLIASGGGGIYSVADNAGYNAAPSTASLPAPLVTPTANTAFRGVALAPVAPATTWTGATSTDWFAAGNWSGGVPSATLDAVVSAGPANKPVINQGTATVRSLTLAATMSLTLASGTTLDLKGNFTNNGTFAATDATSFVQLSGASAQTLGGSALTQIANLTVGPAGATLSGALALQRVLNLTGNLSTAGNTCTLLSAAATGDALVVNNGGVVAGAVTVQRFIDPTNNGLGYRHYAAPVGNTTVGDLATSGFAPVLTTAYNTSATPGTTTPFPTVFAYDQSRLATATNNLSAFDKGFVVPAGTNTPLAVGQGYVVNIGAGQLVDFVGTLTTGDQTIGLARNAGATAADAGWALVGNPYPAPLDYSLVAAADRPNLDGAMYVVQSAGQYTGTYRSYVNGIGNPVVPVAQGFFVRVSPGQTSGSLTFRNAQRLTVPGTTTFQRPTADLRPQVALALHSGTSLADIFYLYAEAGATAATDPQYDAVKLPNSTGLNLASLATDQASLAIDGRPAFTPTTSIALTVGVPAAGSYSLSASSLANLPAGLDAYLLDAQTGQTTKLSVGTSYAFVVTAAEAAATIGGRFTLQFSSQVALAAAAALAAPEVSVYPNPAHGSFAVLLPGVASATSVQAELLNALGQVVRRQSASLPAGGTTLLMPAAGLAPGVYSLRLRAGTSTVVKRVVIN